MEYMKVGRPTRRVLPLCLKQVNFVRQDEASIDLLTTKPERIAGLKSMGVKQILKEALKCVATRLRRQAWEREQLLAKNSEHVCTHGRTFWGRRRGGLPSEAFQPVDEVGETAAGILQFLG